MEKIIVVDQNGIIQKFASKDKLGKHDIIAVELVMVYLPETKRVVLFNRGENASDMHNRWALESGKVIEKDMSREDKIGQKLSAQAYKNAAVREFIEELDYHISANTLQYIDEFYMEKKHIYFALLALPISPDDVSNFIFDQSELDQLGMFSLEEFYDNKNLGDAIMFRKNEICQYLQKIFGET